MTRSQRDWSAQNSKLSWRRLESEPKQCLYVRLCQAQKTCDCLGLAGNRLVRKLSASTFPPQPHSFTQISIARFHHGECHLYARKLEIIINRRQLDELVGMAMLIVATTVFLYYTTWTLLMVAIHFATASLSYETDSLLASTDSHSSTPAILSTTFSPLGFGLSVSQSFSYYLVRLSLGVSWVW